MKITQETIDTVLLALRKNNMDAQYVEHKEDVVPAVEALLHTNDQIAVGGSMSLIETGVLDHLRSGRYQFHDRWAPGLTPEEIEDCHRSAFYSDAYLCSVNAVTLQGELYNVDGNSNRVAAICYGPKSVILVVGCNKIVADITAANLRVRRIAAPKNCARLQVPSYCAETGSCIALTREEPEFCDGCHSPTRICCNYLISARQRVKGRIKVILVGEPLGY